MSTYTTELRYICEVESGLKKSKGYNSINSILDNCWKRIFNFSFPIFDESYRKTICVKILKHYYTREIGEETVGLWKLRLDTKMNEIMPYYNKLYQAWVKEFNPLYNVEVSTEHTLKRSASNKSSGTDKQRYSDTPQGGLSAIENNQYLTNATINDSTTSDTGTSTDDYIQKVYGKEGGETYSEMLEKYRKALLNIDMMIIKDLEPLFMLIW